LSPLSSAIGVVGFPKTGRNLVDVGMIDDAMMLRGEKGKRQGSARGSTSRPSPLIFLVTDDGRTMGASPRPSRRHLPAPSTLSAKPPLSIRSTFSDAKHFFRERERPKNVEKSHIFCSLHEASPTSLLETINGSLFLFFVAATRLSSLSSSTPPPPKKGSYNSNNNNYYYSFLVLLS
jgi:hypothetical protein